MAKHLNLLPMNSRMKEVVLKAVSQNGLALEYAPNELKNDKEFV